MENSQGYSVRSWREKEVRTSWARKILREMVKHEVVREVGVAGRSRTYEAVT
jgi:hypothetical protein